MAYSHTLDTVVRNKFGKYKKAKGKNGTDYIVLCPFCRGKWKMYITPAANVFHCFRCGEAGASDLLLGQQFTVKHTVDNSIKALPSTVDLPGSLISLHDLPGNHPALMYIQNRGFDADELNDVFGVRYCAEGKTYARLFNTSGTLIFPFWLKGNIIGWQARLLYTPDTMSDADCAMMGFVKDEDGDWVKPPKYWTSPGLEKGRILYNYDWAAKSEIVVLCEGVFDALAVGKSGVAALGKGVTEQQIGLIGDTRNWKLVVILLDPGDATREMFRVEAALRNIVRTVKVELQGYKDPGETPRTELWLQIGREASKLGIDLFNYNFLI